MINPVLSNLPKVGIRPTIDGRLDGVPAEGGSVDHEFLSALLVSGADQSERAVGAGPAPHLYSAGS